MASAVDKQPAAARLSAVAAAGCLPTATRGSQNSYTTLWDTTGRGEEIAEIARNISKVAPELPPENDEDG